MVEVVAEELTMEVAEEHDCGSPGIAGIAVDCVQALDLKILISADTPWKKKTVSTMCSNSGGTMANTATASSRSWMLPVKVDIEVIVEGLVGVDSRHLPPADQSPDLGGWSEKGTNVGEVRVDST